MNDNKKKRNETNGTEWEESMVGRPGASRRRLKIDRLSGAIIDTLGRKRRRERRRGRGRSRDRCGPRPGCRTPPHRRSPCTVSFAYRMMIVIILICIPTVRVRRDEDVVVVVVVVVVAFHRAHLTLSDLVPVPSFTGFIIFSFFLLVFGGIHCYCCTWPYWVSGSSISIDLAGDWQLFSISFPRLFMLRVRLLTFHLISLETLFPNLDLLVALISSFGSKRFRLIRPVEPSKTNLNPVKPT